MFVRKNIKTIDIIETENEETNKAFMNSAPCIGRFQTEKQTVTAHILHTYPLLIGTVTSQNSGKFSPLSPNLYNIQVTCTLEGRSNEYSIMKCEQINSFHLKSAFPTFHLEPQNFLGYSQQNQQKVIGREISEPSLKGSLFMDLDERQFRKVVGQNRIIDVDQLHDIYDQVVWPVVDLYFKKGRQKYFTYFRQYEVNHQIPHAGRQGTR